ncbi:30S ribosomal protein S8 [bacterium (Candidatus Moisslbacteria) CG02_land_8_20_14_3_00_36_53]|nr:30S ribosomal protein S8 [Candidatus Kuenenbacteria bacterium]OIP76326.1 MAG: 30S ribosomal protein S8 [Parcubacteria group bacterium CG2_30_36_38]PIV46001.1 MAG: 30S ribosomal protein S8 [bacterium (Candidatus Moisslbacteria) CG02_land_8_20_14_3_00_36_53]PIZ90474.1 MAG: 30S ribosomal protein S8 [bacterium (Candidatus Moisslbacteria) CG_4_10_14_0_2_um_filter_36_61]PJC00901.1 MAG: 30S ribosomal protein S8 [bacterium (Candidatus Moisslbacteria) CG_4_9_14_0_8_um_filter_36_20]
MNKVADALTRLRNALKIKKSEVFLPYSKLVFSIFKILESNKLVAKVEIVKMEKVKAKKIKKEEINPTEIKVILKYDKKRFFPICQIKMISREGLRVYLKAKELKSFLGGRGLLIVSTSSGLMTDQEAREKGVGGEIVCKID